MLIFVYEFLTGGGLFRDDTWPPAMSLLSEGRAMVEAIAIDLAKIKDVQVVVLQDKRLDDLRMTGDVIIRPVASAAQAAEAFAELSATADWTIVIAPEFDGLLASCCQKVLDCGGRLLGPSPQIVQLAANKETTALHLRQHDIPVPYGFALPGGDLESTEPFDCFPAVLKPLHGAGSQDVRLISRRDEMPRFLEQPSRLERFYPGDPVSVAALCGPGGNVVLPASAQRLSDDGAFVYLGGSLPLSESLAARAERLAQKVIATLPQPVGYVGVDMVLGPGSGCCYRDQSSADKHPMLACERSP